MFSSALSSTVVRSLNIALAMSITGFTTIPKPGRKETLHYWSVWLVRLIIQYILSVTKGRMAANFSSQPLHRRCVVNYGKSVVNLW